jgi:hypothetical protein
MLQTKPRIRTIRKARIMVGLDGVVMGKGSLLAPITRVLREEMVTVGVETMITI